MKFEPGDIIVPISKGFGHAKGTIIDNHTRSRHYNNDIIYTVKWTNFRNVARYQIKTIDMNYELSIETKRKKKLHKLLSGEI